MYRFLQNDNVSEDDIIKNMSSNCKNCVGTKSVLCIQDTSEINLYNHRNRIKKDASIGTTQASIGMDWAFLFTQVLLLIHKR